MKNALKLCLIAVIAAPAIVAALSARPPPPPKRGKSKGGKHKRRNKAVEAPSASASIEDREARLRARFASWSGGDDDDDDDGGGRRRGRRPPAEAPRSLGGWGREARPAFGDDFHPPPARRRRGAGGARRAAPRRPRPETAAEKKKEKKKKKPRPVDDALAALGRRAAFADAPGPARDEAAAAPETFEAWDLPASTAAALAAAGFDAPTLAQSALWRADPARDALLAAPTGGGQGSKRERNSQLQRLLSRPFSTRGGKTLAFLLPALAAVDPRDAAVRVLVVAPGRELAVQIADAAATFFPDLEVAAIFGGANAGRMRDRLKKRKPQVVVGTPGRLAEFALDGSRPLKLGASRRSSDDRSALEALRRVLRADDPPCEAAVVFVNDGDAAIAVANALRTRCNVDALPLAGAVSGDDRAKAVRHLAAGAAPPSSRRRSPLAASTRAA
ncbi:helicase [Aureococcus anophagefferens]|nr:helicase [Aureococcus anophagefferens]